MSKIIRLGIDLTKNMHYGWTKDRGRNASSAVHGWFLVHRQASTNNRRIAAGFARIVSYPSCGSRMRDARKGLGIAAIAGYVRRERARLSDTLRGPLLLVRTGFGFFPFCATVARASWRFLRRSLRRQPTTGTSKAVHSHCQLALTKEAACVANPSRIKISLWNVELVQSSFLSAGKGCSEKRRGRGPSKQRSRQTGRTPRAVAGTAPRTTDRRTQSKRS